MLFIVVKVVYKSYINNIKSISLFVYRLRKSIRL